MSEPSTKWFKLWVSSLTDPDLANISNAQFAQWAKLGAYIKGHGEPNGTVVIPSPARPLCAILQVHDFDHLISCISELPNVIVRRLESEHAKISVTYKNFYKYQVDSTSYERKKKQRINQKVHALRGEEKRREEKRTPRSPKTGESTFDLFWNLYPKHLGKQKAKTSWDRLKPDHILLETILKSLELQKKTDEWTKDKGKFVPHPATWLNGSRWEDEVPNIAESLTFLEGVK